ncbi:MAG TPA: helix-turn-helix transcriptional regulator [Pusillimonas sp.]|uniref:helix-turn-helix transcriptional regulator n=1 Tax=Pusillimonas sp. TaxID=3040095 RepID=UPI002CFB41A9|nr:helix-turn-helix transcriptional regulator [Pusillimonas sp.]HUH87242.1 helix-turn-helix transcriptional regulator [Pusillimonas sp.]
MNTWSLDEAANACAPVGAGHADGFASELIDALGEPDFGPRLITRINQLLSVDFFSVYQLEAKATPRMFLSSSRSGHDVSDDCFRSYQQRLHEQDHTFDRAKQTLDAGGVAMVYAHQTHFAPPHRAAIYSRHGIQDRLSVVCRADDNLVLATNFYRFERQPMFGAADADTIQSVARSVAACIGKHISIEGRLRPAAAPDISVLASELAARCPRLTPRELEVCTGLLLGRTYDGIASELGLSVATVKTYRARAYDKLGINFRSQLFGIASRLV